MMDKFKMSKRVGAKEANLPDLFRKIDAVQDYTDPRGNLMEFTDEIRANMKADLVAHINTNRNETACVSCPKFGKCPYLRWEKNLDWVKVTGCSRHPDQKLYKGHSITVEISTVDIASLRLVNSNWNTARNSAVAATCTIGYSVIGPLLHGANYEMHRTPLNWDTTVIPGGSIIAGAKWKHYNSWNGAQPATSQFALYKGLAYANPHSPPTVNDYDRTLYSNVECLLVAASALVLASYNETDLSDPSVVDITAMTKLMAESYTHDFLNHPPLDDHIEYPVIYTTVPDLVANPSILKVTYDIPLPAAPPVIEIHNGQAFGTAFNTKINVNEAGKPYDRIRYMQSGTSMSYSSGGHS